MFILKIILIFVAKLNIMLELKGNYSKDCKIFIDDVEAEAIKMIYEILDKPVSENQKIRIMPDVHAGKGIVIGFTMPLGTMISPNLVGVDIGCGVAGCLFKTSNELDLRKINDLIRENIKFGMNINDNSVIKKYPFDEVQNNVDFLTKQFNKKFNTNYTAPTLNDKWLSKFLKTIRMDESKFYKSLMSIGGGNHYNELGINELGEYLLSVHTGSRNLGQKVCMYHCNQSKNQIDTTSNDFSVKLQEIIDTTENRSEINDKVRELKKTMKKGISKEFLQGEYLYNYLVDVCFTQNYAKLNRQLIIDRILKLMNIQKVEQRFETIHNYVDFSTNDFMIRKGAISAKKDELALIPLSMKDGVLLVKAKGNSDWNYSLNHGAGRVMSRSVAKELISFDDVKKSMDGIVCDLNENVIDESVFAYKDANVIINAITDNAEILSVFKPILNLKDIGKSETWKERNANKDRK